MRLRIATAAPISLSVNGWPFGTRTRDSLARQRAASGMSAVITMSPGPACVAIQSSTAPKPDCTESSIRGLAGTRSGALAAVLAAGGARPEHIVRLTWYVVDRAEYLAAGKALGVAYRAVMGHHYPAMSAVQVAGLMEQRARVEIEATAMVPD